MLLVSVTNAQWRELQEAKKNKRKEVSEGRGAYERDEA